MWKSCRDCLTHNNILGAVKFQEKCEKNCSNLSYSLVKELGLTGPLISGFMFLLFLLHVHTHSRTYMYIFLIHYYVNCG